MMIPSCEEILKLAADYDRIPICREVFADMVTPITLLRRLAERSKEYFLLESVEGGEKWGRYSFLGFNPILRVTLKEGRMVIDSRTEEYPSKTLTTAAPYEELRQILNRFKAPKIQGQPPFAGGFAGYFSYAMIGYAEPVLKISRGNGADMELMLFDQVIAYDHLKQKISIVVNIKTGRRTAEPSFPFAEYLMEEYGNACRRIQETIALIRDQTPPAPQSAGRASAFSCNVSKEEYCRMVEKTREYIRDGDIFQAVISRQFTASFEGSLLNAYRVLRTTNPSPYMVYMNLGETEIISASPETLVRLKDGRLITFPVAGSRPRGNSPTEDEALEAELLADEKELAEHNMLVDLGRNDIGRISSFGTVEVTQYQMIHKYSRIMHICTQVEGKIGEGCDGCSAVEALLPAGTLSGAQKIRACQIIEEMEQVPRGIYGGALGYLDLTGNMDTCIAIRMAVKENGSVTVQAGGGIVADSVPEREYEESENKAGAVMQAIMYAGEADDI